MKNLLTLFAFLLTAQMTMGQSIIERNYSKYLDQEDVTHVYLSGKLFDFASVITAGIEDKDLKELSEFASTITSFSLIKVPDNGSANTEYKKGLSDARNNYEELLRVRDEGQKFIVYVDEEDDVVYEVVGLGVVDGEFIALSLVGEMDLNRIAEFVQKSEMESLAPLKKMAKHNVSDVKIYPNPASTNSTVTIEIPDNMVGASGILYDLNGAKIKTIEFASNKTDVDTNNLKSGSFMIELNKDGVSMRKQLLVID